MKNGWDNKERSGKTMKYVIENNIIYLLDEEAKEALEKADLIVTTLSGNHSSHNSMVLWEGKRAIAMVSLYSRSEAVRAATLYLGYRPGWFERWDAGL